MWPERIRPAIASCNGKSSLWIPPPSPRMKMNGFSGGISAPNAPAPISVTRDSEHGDGSRRRGLDDERAVVLLEPGRIERTGPDRASTALDDCQPAVSAVVRQRQNTGEQGERVRTGRHDPEEQLLRIDVVARDDLSAVASASDDRSTGRVGDGTVQDRQCGRNCSSCHLKLLTFESR